MGMPPSPDGTVPPPELHCCGGNFLYVIYEGACGAYPISWFCPLSSMPPECPLPPPTEWGPGQYQCVSFYCYDVFDPFYKWTIWGCIWCYFPTALSGLDMDALQSHIIARIYSFMNSETYKWEPHGLYYDEYRTYTFADWKDNSNILIKIRPDDFA